MTEATLSSILLELAAGCPREPLHGDCVAFMKANNVPEHTIAMLNSCAFARPLRVGKLWLSRLAEADGDYCEFVEEVGTPELVELAGGNDPPTWFCSVAWDADLDVWDAIRKDSARSNPTASHDLTVYRFSCRTCGMLVLHWDAS